jgi:DEAD/DEAH box helicase domain-containing protein
VNIDEFIFYITAQSAYEGQAVHVEHLAARTARTAATEKPLLATLKQRLGQKGLLPLYTHQAEAVDLTRQGRNVIIATSSASGKTLCYNIPVLETLVSHQIAQALYLFPTKALAQDQCRSLRELVGGLLPPEEIAIFDGDTQPLERACIRRKARLIITNPDMLHLGILPNHQNWSRLLGHLKYVVVDEAHSYRGVFGSHVAQVLRRLRRLCRFYGANPQFIMASATVANPGEHAAALAGVPFAVVSGDGSPHGDRKFVFWNPPLIDEAKSRRGSANSEAIALFTALVMNNVRTLAFARTRRLTELIYAHVRERLLRKAPDIAERVRAYRAGYLPEERRRIEQALYQGELVGLVATNSLELGIDIGSLGATLLVGYPGSIASTWQQAGRSGRGKESALSFLIAMDNPLDQYLMRNPEFFFQSNFEHALINPDNHYILNAHLECAAWELPLNPADAVFFGPCFKKEVKQLATQGRLRERLPRWYLAPSIDYPAQEVNIRSSSGQDLAVMNSATGSLLEVVDMGRAFTQLYQGAVYLHQGDTFIVTEFNLEARTITVLPDQVSYYTEARETTDLRVTKAIREATLGPVLVSLGEVTVTSSVIGYRKKMQFTDEVVGELPLELPPQVFTTVALWFSIPEPAIGKLADAGRDFAGGLHALEHAAIAILPLFALCDRNDIGGVSTPLHSDTGRPTIFIYDAHHGGIGIAENGFDLIGQLWQATLKAIRECPCQDGCPSCIQSPKCGNNNQPLDKQAAVAILDYLLGEANSSLGG